MRLPFHPAYPDGRYFTQGVATLQVKGQAQLSAARSRVWATLLDPEALRRCIPGCDELTPIGPSSWEATMTVGLAGIKGRYRGTVTISDMNHEQSYRLTVEGAGGGNRIKGSGLIALADDARGGTQIAYDGDAHVAGVLAAVGQRLFQPAAKSMAEQFFVCMGKQITS